MRKTYSEVIAIVPAAGLGLRYGRSIKGQTTPYPAAKQYAILGGRPLLIWALEALERSPLISQIVPVLRAGDESLVMSLASEHGICKVGRVVAGGAERQDSVLNGLRSIDGFAGMVLIHDGVRPFLTESIIRRTVEGAGGADGAAASVVPKDTIKRIDAEGIATDTPVRDMLRAVQTPQVFKCAVLREAYERAKVERLRATDDAALVEAAGGRVRMVEGAYTNIKVTTPEDMLLANALVREGIWKDQA